MSEALITVSRATSRRMTRRYTSRNEWRPGMEKEAYLARRDEIAELLYDCDASSWGADYLPMDRIFERLALHLGSAPVTYLYGRAKAHESGQVIAITDDRLIRVTFATGDRPQPETVKSAAVPLSAVRSLQLGSVHAVESGFERGGKWPTGVEFTLVLDQPLLGDEVIEVRRSGSIQRSTIAPRLSSSDYRSHRPSARCERLGGPGWWATDSRPLVVSWAG